MSENNLKDRVKTATDQTKKVFKAYFVGIFIVFITGTIVQGQQIISVEQNQILMGSAVIIGVAVISFQVYMTMKAKREKKLVQ